TDEFKDSWLIVSTPTVTLSSWTGHEIPAPMTTTSGDNNGNYMAYLANALYNANPEIFGIGQKFELDPSDIKSKVSVFTGEK
ncbi:penicillin-binding protein, partial [Enterococcus faecalis]